MSYYAFISHSSYDSLFAEHLFSFLEDGFEIGFSNVFCTSMQGQVRPGTNPHEIIINALKTTEKICYFIISPNTLNSMYCFYEMGAAWALGIYPTLIYLSPLNHNEQKLRNLPFTQVQAIDVDINSEESIHNLAVDINLTLSEKGISKRVGYNRARDAFISAILSISKNSLISLNLRDAVVFHSGSDFKTFRILELSEQMVNCEYDFNISKPEYVGYAIELNNSDWGGHVRSEHSIEFDIDVSNSTSIFIEFKGDNRALISSQRVDITANHEHFRYKLNELNYMIDKWRHMSQLVFVIYSRESKSTSGKIKVSNIRIGLLPDNN
ncbi:MAG TPA: toll/interleukin-1 receptor domain-containing protein [Mobilitalea sp.]|nr:toll/interleukin-1 receptor domain-containing protein [Mobilitalea sp.]